jgi:hypothetical protein
MTHQLPARPSLSSLKYQAKSVLKAHRAGDLTDCTVLRSHTQFSGLSDAAFAAAKVTLSDAQHALAVDYGFGSWTDLKSHVLQQPPQPSFSDEALNEFHSSGFVKLRGAVPTNAVRKMEDAVWTLLEQRGLRKNDPPSWQFNSPAKSVQDLHQVSKLAELKNEGTSPEDYQIVREALDVAFGDHPRAAAPNWGQPLVTFPHRNGPWMMPNNFWHFDHRYFQRGEINGVNVFLFINDVDAEGGGTVVVKSAPLLMDRLLDNGAKLTKLSEQNKAFLNSHPWLRGLKTSRKEMSIDRNRRYMDADTDIDGIRTRVVELTGKAGDVFLCHPAMFHAPAPNVANQPRLMRTQRISSQPIRDYLVNAGRQLRNAD